MSKREAARSLAVVLKRYDFGETSQTAKILCRESGRISVLAKGIKRGGPELRGPMDLFALAEVATRARRGTDLHLLVKYRVVTGFPGLRQRLERLYAAFYCTEIVLEGTRELDPDPPLFDALVQGLGALEAAPPSRIQELVAGFEAGYLGHAGFFPNFDACVLCAKIAPPGKAVRFSVARSGIVCRACNERRPHQLVTVRAATRAALLALLARSRGGLSISKDSNPNELSEVRKLLPAILEHTLERELRSASFLEL